MDIFDLLFGWGGQAMQLIFQYGFILKEEDFLELTDEQYVQFHIKMGECNEKIFLNRTGRSEKRNRGGLNGATDCDRIPKGRLFLRLPKT